MMEFGLNRQRNAFKQCMRCGESHIFGKCCAYNATCNNCHRMGHFARVCRSRNFKLSKSSRTKQRDMQRMSEFIRKKTAECNFPFHNEDTSCLKNHAFNSLSYGQQQSAISTLQNHNKALAKNIDNLKEEIQISNSEMKDAKRMFSEANKYIFKLEQEIQDLRVNLTACKQQNNSLSHTIATLPAQNEALEHSRAANLEFQRTVPQISHKREVDRSPLAEHGNPTVSSEDERLIKNMENLTKNVQLLSEVWDQSVRPKQNRHRGGRQNWKKRF